MLLTSWTVCKVYYIRNVFLFLGTNEIRTRYTVRHTLHKTDLVEELRSDVGLLRPYNRTKVSVPLSPELTNLLNNH